METVRDDGLLTALQSPCMCGYMQSAVHATSPEQGGGKASTHKSASSLYIFSEHGLETEMVWLSVVCQSLKSITGVVTPWQCHLSPFQELPRRYL